MPKKRKPKIIIQKVKNEKVNFVEFVDQVLNLIDEGKIPKKNKKVNKKYENPNQQ